MTKFNKFFNNLYVLDFGECEIISGSINLNKEEYPFEKFNDKLKNYNYFKRTASNSTTTYIVYMQKHLKCDNLKLKIAFSKFISFIFSQCAF